MRATIFFLTFAIFVAALVLRVDQVMFGDKLAASEAQSRAQMASLSQALSSEIRALKDILTLSFNEIEQGRTDFSSARPYSRFQMVAKLLPPNTKVDGKNDWQIVSSFFQEKSPTRAWASPYVTLALKTVRPGEVRPGASHFFALMDPQRKPFLLMLFNSSGNWYAGLLGSETFQGLMDRQKGQKSTMYVVNIQGQALAHTTQEYIGSLLTEDPLVAELMKSSVGSGFGSFKDLKGELIQGLYEQVDNTNMFAVIATPVKTLVMGRNSTRLQLILLGAGLGLIGLAVFFFADRGQPSNAQAAASRLPPVIAPATPVPATVTSGQVSSGEDRMKAYVQVASSLSHELKSPLTSILGYSQLAMNQMPDGGPKEHLQKIDQEARAAREMIQKLLIFAGEDKVPSQKVGLETAVAKALKNVEGKILSKGIKLTKNFQPVTAFTMPVDLVVRAIENILINSIEALERNPRKELTVSLKSEGEDVVLSIEDTGEGISAQNLPKVFDPFFTTKGNINHVGLGLSTAMGIFKEIAGEMQIDSHQGQGTQVHIRFHVNQIASTAAAEMPAQKAIKAPPMVAPAPVAAKAPELKEEPMDPLLVDNTIERLIEGDVPDMPPLPTENFKLNLAAEVLKAPPQTAMSAESGGKESGPLAPAVPSAPVSESMSDVEMPPPKPVPAVSEKPAFSAKIDKPKIEIKKKTSRVDEEVQIAVRRPGERQ